MHLLFPCYKREKWEDTMETIKNWLKLRKKDTERNGENPGKTLEMR